MRHSLALFRHISPLSVLLPFLFLTMSGCSTRHAMPDGGHSPAGPQLFNTTWRAVEILGRKASFFPGQKIDAHFVLHSGDGRVSGSSGCNNLFGGYRRQPGRLSFSSLGTTRMACMPSIMEQERRFLDAMRTTVSYRISGRRLVLLDSGGRSVMELIPVR
jgi:heat shock protein HslJ